MALDISKFKVRVTSALVFGIIMILGFFINQVTFTVLLGIIAVLILGEWTNLACLMHNNKSKVWVISCCILGASIYSFIAYFYLVISKNEFNSMSADGMDAMFKILLYFSMIFAGLTFFLVIVSGDFKRLFVFSQCIIGLLFIPVSLAMLIPLYSWYIPAIILFSVWVNDTFAYLMGSWFGKRSLASAISPNKTIEGTLLGILMTLIVAYIVSLFFHGNESFAPLTSKHNVVIAFITSVMGTIGDLIQSQLKRWANVKDSGKIMPGHGGAYDRFDSFIFAIPWVCAYMYFFYN